jgi:hypothetical protein
VVAIRPPEPRLVHRLPPAPNFVGREAELAELRRLWESGCRGVLALVGLGGAGKTAVAARFLDDLLRPACGPRPYGLFVWSFYQEPDAGAFLREAYHYFAGDAATVPAKGAGLLHLLRERLGDGRPHLLVLDGLERVQREESEGNRSYGEIEDPLLRALLTRIASGIGRTTALVTSRFPLTDLHWLRDKGYRHLDVGGLDGPAALALLRARGVVGDDTVLERLVADYGAHALTLDHLGGLIGQFLGGDPSRAPEAPALGPTGDRQGLRLARLLHAYESHLPPAELALLCRLCLLRRSATEEQIVRLFLCTPAVHARAAREIADRIARLPDGERHPAVRLRDLARAIDATLEDAFRRSPIAGPREVFRQEVLKAVVAVYEMQDQDVDSGPDLVELARLYAGQGLEHPTDRRPLPPEDRAALRDLCAQYAELYNHPLLPFREPSPALEQAFQSLGLGKRRRQRVVEDLSPYDVLRSLKRVIQQLRYLAGKHSALKRVRELGRLYQQKWVLAGDLAPLGEMGLRQVLDALVGRHLVLRESDGSFSVHPAVRDHFGRPAAAGEQGSWHDLLREQLVSLVERPGKRLPEDAASLDLVEEAIYHAGQAGRPRDAADLYAHVLGGVRHLGWKLGEMTRGRRILQGFDPCPEPWDLAWYLRALGEFEEAYRHNNLDYFRADIRLLQGRLPAVAAEGNASRTAVAAFLMGETTALPDDNLGGVVPRDQLLLYLGRLGASRSALLADFYQGIGWEGDRARCELLQAEARRGLAGLDVCREPMLDLCREHLETASRWILHAGSVEHLCLYHLIRARAARTAGDGETARHAAEEGLHLACQCGLGLYHVELLCEVAEQCLGRSDAAAAGPVAAAALERAAAAACRFAWGEAEAGHLLGQALALQGRWHEARPFLAKAFALRCHLRHPGTALTERLLAGLRG